MQSAVFIFKEMFEFGSWFGMLLVSSHLLSHSFLVAGSTPSKYFMEIYL